MTDDLMCYSEMMCHALIDMAKCGKVMTWAPGLTWCAKSLRLTRGKRKRKPLTHRYFRRRVGDPLAVFLMDSRLPEVDLFNGSLSEVNGPIGQHVD